MILLIRRLYATASYIAYSFFSSKDELSLVIENHLVSFYNDNIEFKTLKDIVEKKYDLKVSKTRDQEKLKEIEVFLNIFVAYYCEEMTKDYIWFQEFRNQVMEKAYNKLIRRTKWYVFT